MPRPKKDGTPAAPANKRNLTELLCRKARAEGVPLNIWDTKEPGLVLRVQPSGHRAFFAVYCFRGQHRWYHVGLVPLGDARRIAAKIRLAVAEGKDPVAERQAERSSGTFAELATLYLEQHAKKKNRSWEQADYLVKKNLLPRWSKLDAKSISRSDVRLAMASISSPSMANQTLAAASAIFSWAIKQDRLTINPCHGIERHETKSRERVLSDSELPLFWRAFDCAGLIYSSIFKLILLTGQRPGEVCHMRWEHIVDGWWSMPGRPEPSTGWPGTKNGQGHRVWLPHATRGILAELSSCPTVCSGFVLGRAVSDAAPAMREVCSNLKITDKVTPHDLRRTHGTCITRLGYSRHIMNRVQNHREGGIADVYDRFGYEAETKQVMEAVATHILRLAEGLRKPVQLAMIKGY
jgi:integrase